MRAVIVGFDHHFNYTKLAKAKHYLSSQPECLFLAANMDSSYPDVHHILPGTGSIVSAIQVAAGREPKVIGKPNTLAFEAIRAIHPEIDARSTLMVGDKLQSDVAFGLACGMHTLLVETGIHQEADAYQHPIDEQPRFIAASVAELQSEGP